MCYTVTEFLNLENKNHSIPKSAFPSHTGMRPLIQPPDTIIYSPPQFLPQLTWYACTSTMPWKCTEA
jgi:hypothetical protein